jgi:histone demethylase JARID1
MGSQEQCLYDLSFYNTDSNILSAAPKKPSSSVVMPSPIPPPVFYDKDIPDMKIGTSEVRNTNIPAVNISSPTIYREQQNCEICHKKNRGEEMLLCDGCDCGQ